MSVIVSVCISVIVSVCISVIVSVCMSVIVSVCMSVIVSGYENCALWGKVCAHDDPVGNVRFVGNISFPHKEFE